MAVYRACKVNLIKYSKIITASFPSAGFPNVTMAPDSSQGPIVVNQDPVTQAILSESITEPQVMCCPYSHQAFFEIVLW